MFVDEEDDDDSTEGINASSGLLGEVKEVFGHE
jgi:hypothetical protein